jgi:hypothetical protein
MLVFRNQLNLIPTIKNNIFTLLWEHLNREGMVHFDRFKSVDEPMTLCCSNEIPGAKRPGNDTPKGDDSLMVQLLRAVVINK